MLNDDDNELLTRVSAGTPMGELLRRFWMPAVLSREIEKDGPPVRFRILGENLLAFRDSNGSVGAVDAYCSHRGAPLFFGRNEDCGIRCPYHGWKFDTQGHCVDLPNVPANRNTPAARERVGIKAYPAVDAGGLIWVYMGPVDKKPPLPDLEWMHVPDSYRHVSRWLQRSNFMQGVEGEIDSSHISFLHKEFDPDSDNEMHRAKDLSSDGAPELTLRETDYGFRYGARRQLADQHLWRMTHWLLPMFSLIPKAPGDVFTHGGGRAWVPIDDENTCTFSYNFRIDQPLTAGETEIFDNGSFFPPRLQQGSATLADNTIIDTFLPVANRGNDYLMDREVQRTRNFTGIWGANEQDRSLQEGMRRKPGRSGTVDRSREHLVGSDLAIVTARRKLIKLARDLQAGIEPAIVSQPQKYAVRALSQICRTTDFDEFEKSVAHLAKSAAQ
jgi:phenylpropionate dioxygenase-like ring-hydroxylating dioxygenase large terminal subunit